MSVSETPDLAVLGMLEGEDKLFLGAVLTPLVHSEARIAYGGRGQITDFQQPPYGQQVMDVILPF